MNKTSQEARQIVDEYFFDIIRHHTKMEREGNSEEQIKAAYLTRFDAPTAAKCPLCDNPVIEIIDGFGKVVELHCKSCKNIFFVKDAPTAGKCIDKAAVEAGVMCAYKLEGERCPVCDPTPTTAAGDKEGNPFIDALQDIEVLVDNDDLTEKDRLRRIEKIVSEAFKKQPRENAMSDVWEAALKRDHWEHQSEIVGRDNMVTPEPPNKTEYLAQFRGAAGRTFAKPK